jgi:maleate isomerase
MLDVMTSLATAAPVINYGTRLRLGVMFPSANYVAEPQITAMLPPGVSLHTTRLQLKTGDKLGMLDRLEEAVELLTDAQVQCLAFHCTAVTMWQVDMADIITARIKALTDTPVVVTSTAVVAALREVGARRIILVSPYVQETNDHEIALLDHYGITVLRDRALGIQGAGAMGQVTPEKWIDVVTEMRDDTADAYFVSCTAIKSAETIDRLEAVLQRPVLTSNQAMLWQALRSSGISDPVAGFGRLFRDH